MYGSAFWLRKLVSPAGLGLALMLLFMPFAGVACGPIEAEISGAAGRRPRRPTGTSPTTSAPTRSRMPSRDDRYDRDDSPDVAGEGRSVDHVGVPVAVLEASCPRVRPFPHLANGRPGDGGSR